MDGKIEKTGTCKASALCNLMNIFQEKNGNFVSVKEGSIKGSFAFYRNTKEKPNSRGSRIKTRPMKFFCTFKEAETALEEYAKTKKWVHVSDTLDSQSEPFLDHTSQNESFLTYPKNMDLFSFAEEKNRPAWVNADRRLCNKYISCLKNILPPEQLQDKDDQEIRDIILEATIELVKNAQQCCAELNLQELDALRKKFLFDEKKMKPRSYKDSFCGEYDLVQNR